MEPKNPLTESTYPQKNITPIEGLRREIDSLDDFEHLGHDSSPLKDSGDLLSSSLIGSSARDELGLINKGVGKTATFATTELSSFDPLKPTSSLVDMDSNLLEMGDNFPDRKEADEKLDKFLQEMSTFAPVPPKHEEVPEVLHKDEFNFKSATQVIFY